MSYPPAAPFGRGRGGPRPYGYAPYRVPPRGRGSRWWEGDNGGNVLDNGSTVAEPLPPQVPLPTPRFDIAGLTFELIKQGSKLKRITPLEGNAATPEKHEIAGVKFFRTKGGNLLRHKEYIELQEKRLSRARLCPKFTRTGQCSRDCGLTHDIKRVAVCKSFLMKKSCSAGSYCSLSHDLTPNRVPLCNYFLRGNCTNPKCQYSHKVPTENALVCDPFARLGYCEEGDKCPNKHIFECPDYTNKGKCDDEDCRLPHIERARLLRRSAGVSSNEHSDSDAVELDLQGDPLVICAGDEPSTTAFSQQVDFIALGD